MKLLLTIIISAIALFSLSSCGDSRDKLMQDQVDMLNDMAEVVEDVAEGNMSSAEAAEKFAEFKKDGADIMERKKALMKDITAEEGNELREKYSKESGKAMMRYVEAVKKLGKSGRMTKELQDAVENLSE